MRKYLVLVYLVISMIFFSGIAYAIPATSGLDVTRITNPQASEGQPDGIKPWGDDSPDYHFRGDRWNSYIWSMTCFTPKDDCCQEQGSELWVGTNRNLLYSAFLGLYFRYLQEDFSIEEFDYVINKLFCGNVPTGYHLGDCIDKDFRAQIWKWPLCDGPWELVYQSDFDDYNCCDAYYDDWDWLNSDHPLCCTRKWIFGPDWGYREAGTYTPSCGIDCYPEGPDEVCCSWPRVVFGNSRSFLNPDIPNVERLRTIGFGHPGSEYFPEELICDEDFTQSPFGGLVGDNVSFRVVTNYKADGCTEPEGCGETANYDHLIVGSETALYMTCDMEEYYKIWELGEEGSDGFGILFEAVQYKNYLYVTLGGQNGFQLIRGKPGNVCANPVTASESCPCPSPEYCPWEWEVLVGPGGQFCDGMGRESYAAASLAVCDDCLYVGTFTVWFIEEMLEFVKDWEGDQVYAQALSEFSAQSDLSMAAETFLEGDPDAPKSLTGPEFSFLLNFTGGFTRDWLELSMTYDKKCGTQVYRYCAGDCGEEDSWDLVAGAPTLAFPEGSISNIKGDGWSETSETSNKFNAYTWRMICCNGKLYATTFDVRAAMSALTECWCEEDCLFADLLECMDISVAEDLCCILDTIRTDITELAYDNPYGFDMYRLENPGAVAGLQWTMITQDGFGDKYNYGGRTLECCDCDGENCVFVGTANPFWGGQVWKVCPADQPEPVVITGTIGENDCAEWELTLEPEGSGEVSGTLVETMNPSGGEERGYFFDLVLSGDIASAELCIDGEACVVPDLTVDGFFFWNETDSAWEFIQSITGTEFCATIPLSDVGSTSTWGVGDSSTFPIGDDDDDDDDGNGTPGGDEPTTSSSGGGCNVGTGAAVLLLLVPLGVLWFKRF